MANRLQLPAPPPRPNGRPPGSAPKAEAAALSYDGGYDRTPFTKARFIAFVEVGKIKLTQSGALELILIVPPGFVEDAMEMRHLAKLPVPLDVSIEILAEAREDLDESEFEESPF